jgi:two-component system, NtrC family, sensor kinase
MVLLEISIQARVIIGISAMILLFCSFLVVFITNQRKRLQYHRELQVVHEEQRKNLQQQNLLLEEKVNERTLELKEKAEKLEQALDKLKASQLQLIQKEKMASLGELTAGIAHEIQNPLNFVNNFAEINTDIILEIKQFLTAANLPPDTGEEINALMNDLIENQKKIKQYGKRAENIVKGMLQHSRKQSGEMELADLNGLLNEYLQLSYEHFQATNKLFTCNLTTNYDGNAGRVNMVKEDIGNILRNLFSNAFYSMKEKMAGDPRYQPVLMITTQKKGGKIFIAIRDNGQGIPAAIINKIFQPFFTTKPPGEGTGLGLSMSYDIIKAHQGELKVNAVEGEFAEFIIELNY